MKTLTLYTRRSCCLCHDALEIIRQVTLSHPVELRIVDLDRDLPRDDPRRARFAIDIPVLEIDGSIAFRHLVDAEALRSLLGAEDTP